MHLAPSPMPDANRPCIRCGACDRVVRRMMDTVGHPVDRLGRTRIGPVRLGTLPVGETRELSREELGALLDLIKM